MGYGHQATTTETKHQTERLLPILQTTFKGQEMKTFRKVLEDMSLAPTGKGREAAKKLYKKEDEIQEVSPAQRRARKQASLLKTMAKYGLARKMGIPASQVNQRRSHPTRKKS